MPDSSFSKLLCGDQGKYDVFLMYRHYPCHNPPFLLPIFAKYLTMDIDFQAALLLTVLHEAA